MTRRRKSPQASSPALPAFMKKQHFSPVKGHLGQDGWYCKICTIEERAYLECMTGRAAIEHERTHEHARKLAKRELAETAEWLEQQANPWVAKPVELDKSAPFESLRSFENMDHVDKLRDLVPFWRDGVMAAERGEEAGRMEDFLERLEEEWKRSHAWGKSGDDGWGMDTGAELWGFTAGWDVPANNQGARTPAWGAQQKKRDDQGWAPVGAAWVMSSETASEKMSVSSHGGQRRNIPSWSARRGKQAKDRSRDVPEGEDWKFVETVAQKEAATAEQTKRMHEFFEMPTQTKLQKIEEIIRTFQA